MEDAGVHSGDATLMFPAQTISQGALEKVNLWLTVQEEYHRAKLHEVLKIHLKTIQLQYISEY